MNPLLKRSGSRIRYVNFARHPDARPNLEGYDRLVVLGGPMSANDSQRLPHLTTEMKLIEEGLKANLPVLGICLGAQLIAKTLGAEVYPSCKRKVGWCDVSPTADAGSNPLLSKFNVSEKIFQWHGETFDIPKSARHLAFSCFLRDQAFRYESNVFGFQFHLEVDAPMIHRWLRVPDNQKEIALLGGASSYTQIFSETPAYMGRLTQLSEGVFGEFIGLFGIEKTSGTCPQAE